MNAAIICELNPLHSGHEYLVKKAREVLPPGTLIFAIMSGNYVQRGAPAIIDKWSRAKMAVLAGFDAVIEIPSIYACSSAQYFAEAGVKIAEAAGADVLVFGSETGDIAKLTEAADAKAGRNPEIQKNVQELMKEGRSYPAAMMSALSGMLGIEELGPNDILATEYISAIKRTGAGIKPIAVLRIGSSAHHDDDFTGDMYTASAKSIRNALLSGNFENENEKNNEISKFIPQKSYKILSERLRQQGKILCEEDYSQMIISKVRAMSKAEMKNNLPFMTAGIENLIFDACRKYGTLSKVASSCTGKTYTRTRIMRSLFSVLTRAKADDFEGNETHPAIVRVLAVDASKKNCLSEISKCVKERNMLFVAGNLPPDFETDDSLTDAEKSAIMREAEATDMYVLPIMNDELSVAGQEFSTPLAVLKK